MGERLTIRLVGGGPWGFRLQGGAGTPLTVSKIRRRSRAQHHLLEGDRILSINGVTCLPLNYDQAMAIVDAADNTLNIDIVRGGTSGKENRDPSSISATSQQPKEAVVTREVSKETKHVISTQAATVKTKTTAETIKPQIDTEIRLQQAPKQAELSTQATPKAAPATVQPKPTSMFASDLWDKPESPPVTSSPEPAVQLPVFSPQLEALAPELAALAPELAALDTELALASKPEVKYPPIGLPDAKPKFTEPPPVAPKSTAPEPVQRIVPEHGTPLVKLAPELADLAPELAALDSELAALGSAPLSSKILAEIPETPKQSQRQQEVTMETTSDGQRYQSLTTETSAWSDAPQHQASSFLQKKETVEVSGGQTVQSSMQKETKSQEVYRVTKVEKQSSSGAKQLSPESLQDSLSWRPTSPIFQKPLLPPSHSPLPPTATPSPTPRPYSASPTPYAQSQTPYAPAPHAPSPTPPKAPAKEDAPTPAVWSPPSLGVSEKKKKKVPPPTPPKPSRKGGPPQVPRPISAPPRDFDISDAYDTDQPYQGSSIRLGQSSKTTDKSYYSAVSDSEDWLHSPHQYGHYSSEDEMGSTSLFTRRKKMFSSSSFYEEPHCIYPTVEEQVELARKIAGSLSNDNNKKSKGANMFFKRVKRSHTWIHEGPDPYSDGGITDSDMEPTTPDTGPSRNYIKVSAGPPRLKLILDPRQLQDLTKLRSSGQNPVEHTAVSPDICMDLVRDLNSPRGKGAALFAKRRQKAEEWVVDDEKVKQQIAQNKADAAQLLEESLLPFVPSGPGGVCVQNRLKLIKSPWEAALESPIGSCDAAFVELPPVTSSVAHSIIKAAENKARIAPAAATYTETPYTPQPDVYRIKAPRGWMGSATGSVPSIYSDQLPSKAQEAPAGDSRSFVPGPSKRPSSFHDFNTIPRSWNQVNQNMSGQRGFKSVRAPK